MDKDDFYSALDYSHLLIDGIVLNAKMKALFIYYPRAIEKARQYFTRWREGRNPEIKYQEWWKNNARGLVSPYNL